MDKKQRRLRLICRLVETEEIDNQLLLQKRMKEQGEVVSQATLSRDLKEIGVQRICLEKGKHRYRVSQELIQEASNRQQSSPLGFSGIYGQISTAGAVIHTAPGQAQQLAKWIDGMKLLSLAGTIAGHDTVLLLMAPGSDPYRLLENLRIEIRHNLQ
ncbi:hypothetical protein HQ45_08790 [Porphyromonas crevioricanis]|nr:arginine repressor [Porphyromonas crevioricanis]KGN88779.1 hypothetical protein HQ45_08790 [Porphyromonas crevioricanis]KGN96472.1 hypothetical protein HQ38_01435 [Porphyromonas crevioricanis]GAD05490.1 arginine repressor [Porphyromonas crevioricanis JCM 15906]GAD07717.1 arginine repressor [Porphyromonas crevioricanis JCM 13913]